MAAHRRKIFSKAQRFFSKDIYRQKLLFEAAFYMLFARFLIAVVPFRYLSMMLEIKPKGTLTTNINSTEIAQQISWAIECAARNLPFTLVCFPQGIAAYLMMQRRRLDVTLFYGINSKHRDLSSHVWVKHGNNCVIGCEQSNDYIVIMSYPQITS